MLADMIRVGFYKNIGNIFTTLCRTIEALDVGIDPRILVDKNGKAKHRPDQTLDLDQVDWIEWVTHPGKPRKFADLRRHRRAEVVARMAMNDLNFASSADGLIFAHASKRPYIFFVTGGDLTVDPFWENHQRTKAAFLQWSQLRLALRSPRLVGINMPPFKPLQTAISKLGISESLLIPKVITQSIDTSIFSPAPAGHVFPDSIERIRSRHDFIIFHPPRMMWSSVDKIESGQIKRNDLLLRALREFLDKHPDSRPLIIMIRRGEDLEATYRLISELKLEANTMWFDQMVRKELIDYYRASDVVANEFGAGWYGSIVIEGLSVGKPVLNGIDREATSGQFARAPVLSAFRVEEILAWLERLYLDEDFRREQGLKSRQYVIDHYSDQRVANRCVEVIRDCVQS